MHRLAKQFAAYCERNFDLEGEEDYNYRSLPVCIIDCVYSLRTHYCVAELVVDRYAEAYMNGNSSNPSDTITMFLQRIDENGGPQKFAANVLKNNQKLGGKAAIPKEDVCFQLAQYLKYLHIDTLEDFRNFESQELLEIVVRSVKGMGDAGVNYLFMLAGDPCRCKPDVHIHQCIKDACGCDLSNEECQELFTDAVFYLSEKHPKLTVRCLDGIIWRRFSN